MKKVSQRDIADHLEVSQALVSLVLNGKREGVSADTYRRIWEYAEKSGYRSRGRDRALDGKALATVGYVLRSPLRLAATSNFFSEVLEGLDQYLVGNLGRTTFLGSEDDLANRPLREMIEGDAGFRGIVIMGEVGEACLDRLIGLGCPLVYVSARAPGLCHSVNANEAMAASLIVDHLLELGHQRFGFVGIGCRARGLERLEALRAALRRRGIDPAGLVEHELPEAMRHHGWQAAEAFLALPENEWPTAWITAGGLLARGALDALVRLAPAMLKTVSVASLDATRTCFEESPRITAAGVHPDRLGREAGRLLLSLTGRGEIVRDLALPAELLGGESTFAAQS